MEGCLTCPAHVDPYLFILQQSAIALLAKVQLCERGNEGGEGGQMCQQQSDLYLDFALCLLSKASPSEAREREREGVVASAPSGTVPTTREQGQRP